MFIYNGKIWNPKNPEKKLKQLGITWDDVEVIKEKIKEEIPEEIDTSVKRYYFKNDKGEIVTSIYNNLDNLKEIIDIKKYYEI